MNKINTHHNSNNYKEWIVLGSIIPILILGRLIDHPPNFVPILAITLFCGSFIRPTLLGLVLPISAMLISDLYLGFYGSILFVYFPIILSFFIGSWITHNTSILRVGIGLLSSSLLFFIVSNFGVWLTSGFYPLNITGIIKCYIAAVPFFHNTLLSTIIYGTTFYTVWNLIGKNRLITIDWSLPPNHN